MAGARRAIAHVDMDAFYVSVELARRPELRGKPVVVAGSGPRSVVTTASYEARKFGIFSATPAARARRACPDAVFLTPDFDAYRERSREVMAVLREQVERVEVAGLDEAYLDLSGLEAPKAAARRAKQAVTAATGLGCSVGLGPNKLVAKVASDAEKPDGFVVLTRAQACERFADASPGLIPGIGPKTLDRLRRGGVETLAALAEADQAALERVFGPDRGGWLKRVARFEDARELELKRVRKSESCETTFDRDLRDLDEMVPPLDALSARLCERVGSKGLTGRTIGIKVRLNDFSIHTRVRTIEEPTNDPGVVSGVARELLRTYDPPRPVRLLGVRIAGLDTGSPVPERIGQLELGP